ncbi:SDR family NAD(P)-dependent oxidoreductase [Legionella spiritensis]|uniref:Short-chain dehydrogenase/reductase n=1 Tax=Legionella spiritensis TaxID=452 RepID=A0A0W0Z5A6_LEGSP|nr:SDR family oxidoreductase [Legionella spiritensis]KTD64285.1 short-chain dehydrogenase/reductase [Legionella spiritensis]SNV46921.1 short-chain dehydrogenase/reductase [Legionella spiritensis]
MDLKLTGKKALVTGSTKGIGLAIAQRLDKEGAHVIINGRSQESIDKALSQLSDKAIGIVEDISTAPGAASFIQKISQSSHSKPEIVINNLGIYEPQSFLDITDQQWQHFFEINVMSGVRMSRAFLPEMIQNNWGRIIFISSESAFNIPEEMIHYGMTKLAQIGIARGLAETVKGTGITVNSVLPGPTLSEGVQDFIDDLAKDDKSPKAVEDEFFQKVRPTSLLQRFIEPHEIANIVAYIASPLSSATTGASIRADGGTYKSI